MTTLSPRRAGQIWLGVLVVFLGVVYLLRAILTPFVAGMAVAYFLDPVADWLEAKGLSRTLATVVITLGFLVILLALVALLVPVLQGQIAAFVKNVPGYIDALRQHLGPLFRHLEERLSIEGLKKMSESAGLSAGQLMGWVTGAVGGLWSGGLVVANLVGLVFITPVVAFYLLRDWDFVVAKVDSYVPVQHRETVRQLARDVDNILAGFVRGQATVCLLLGIFYATGLTLAGLEFGLVVGLAAGLISFVPYLGSISGFVVSVGLALAQSSDLWWVLLVAVIFGVGQAIEGNFLTPALVGDKVRLHPVWVIFALLAGGALFGFVGVLLAVPVAAVVGVMVRFLLQTYRESSLYMGDETAVDDETPS